MESLARYIHIFFIVDLRTIMPKYTPHPNIVSRKIAGEMILIPIRARVVDMNYLYTLNETAARIWQLLDGKTSLEEIQERICVEFEIDSHEAKTDLEQLVQDLLKIDAIVAVEAV